MRKLVCLILAVTAALCLTTVAFADAIVGPAVFAAAIVLRLIPYILVAAVVIITISLLRKFRKRK